MMRDAIPRILVYGEYPTLVVARAAALSHLDCHATPSLNLQETVDLAGSFDAVLVCTSASPGAVTLLQAKEAALPQTTFLFLRIADIGEAKRWLDRVAAWKASSFSPKPSLNLGN